MPSRGPAQDIVDVAPPSKRAEESGNIQATATVSDSDAESAKLREALRLRDCALDAVPSGIVIIDMQRSGRPIVYANRALVKRTGYSAEELIGMRSSVLTPRDSNPESTTQIRDAMKAGRELRIEYQTARKDGSLYWTGTTLVPVLGSSGCVTHYVSSSADITARRDAELLRQRDRQRLAAIVESALEAVIVVDSGFLVTFVNRTAETIFGRPSGEVVGQRLDILIPERLRDAYYNLLRRFSISDDSKHAIKVSDSLFGLRANGDEFPFEGSVSRVSIGDQLVLTIMLRDVSEQLKAQRQRTQLEAQLRLAQKLESVGQLAAGIAHEINTPIQYVGDSVSFLQSSREDGLAVLQAYRDGIAALERGASLADVKNAIRTVEQKIDVEFYEREVPEAFKRTMEGIEHVTKIVRAMKEFSHPDAMDHEPADINHGIETTLVVARNEYKYVAVVEARLQELPLVICNIGELNQVFLNLLVNASHAIAESGKDSSTGHILVASVVDGDHVKITVRDNGCGIPEQNLRKVFDPFFTTKGVGKGTGQGLAITRSIVVIKHGGSVDIKSEVGVGTTFTLRLPIMGRSKKEVGP